MKLRYRHSSISQKPTLRDPWEILISSQIRKYANRIDPLNAWQRREFFILEKLSAGKFDQQLKLVYGSVFGFAADMQLSKLARLHRGSRRPKSPRKWWSQVLQSGWFRLKKTRQPPPRDSQNGWYIALLAFVKGLGGPHDRESWRGVIYNGWRRRGHGAIL